MPHEWRCTCKVFQNPQQHHHVWILLRQILLIELLSTILSFAYRPTRSIEKTLYTSIPIATSNYLNYMIWWLRSHAGTYLSETMKDVGYVVDELWLWTGWYVAFHVGYVTRSQGIGRPIGQTLPSLWSSWKWCTWFCLWIQWKQRWSLNSRIGYCAELKSILSRCWPLIGNRIPAVDWSLL